MYYTDDQFKGNVPKYEVSFYTEEKNNSLRTVNCIVNSASIELRRYMKKLATPQKKNKLNRTHFKQTIARQTLLGFIRIFVIYSFSRLLY